MFKFIKGLFKKEKPDLDKSIESLKRSTGSLDKNISSPVKNKKKSRVVPQSKGYNPNQETIFPIDLNAKNIESLDCICLLAGFTFINNRWYPDVNDKDNNIARNDVATMSNEVLDYINEWSTLTKFDYNDEMNNREKLYEMAMAYQNKILECNSSNGVQEVEVGTVKLSKGKTYLTLDLLETDLVSKLALGERFLLLGPNMQIRYILEPVVLDDSTNTATCKMLGLHTRAPKSKQMFVVQF